MNEFIQMCLEMVLQASPIVAVLAVLLSGKLNDALSGR